MQTQEKRSSWRRCILTLLVLVLGVGATSVQTVKAEQDEQTMTSTAEFRIVGDIPDLEVKPPVGEVIPPKHKPENKNPYPQTGEKQSQSLSILGFGLIVVILGLIVRERRRPNAVV